jgi:hypothetical protein
MYKLLMAVKGGYTFLVHSIERKSTEFLKLKVVVNVCGEIPMHEASSIKHLSSFSCMRSKG